MKSKSLEKEEKKKPDLGLAIIVILSLLAALSQGIGFAIGLFLAFAVIYAVAKSRKK